MAYYYNKTADLANLGKEAFDDIDTFFPHGRNSKHLSASTTVVPPTRTPQPQQVFHYHRYQPQQAYVVQQQVYHDAQIAAMRTERVINSNDAAKMYGGTLYVDYPKRKPARKGTKIVEKRYRKKRGPILEYYQDLEIKKMRETHGEVDMLEVEAGWSSNGVITIVNCIIVDGSERIWTGHWEVGEVDGAGIFRRAGYCDWAGYETAGILRRGLA
ncbi:hypothetical protein Tco_0318194 [Tanacetum coccineum]